MAMLQTQPKTEIVSNVTATVSLDPASVRPRQEAIYRVTFNALEESIEWTNPMAAPPGVELRAGGHGQILQFLGTAFVPLTTFNYSVRAARAGEFTVPSFSLKVYGKPVSVPPVRLRVIADLPASAPTAQRLVLEVPTTSPFVGQPMRARVTLPASAAGQLLIQVQLDGEGFLLD